MKNDAIREGICDRLAKHHPGVPIQDLSDTLTDADKDLFVKYRDGQLTYDQLRARIAERRYNTVYKCLDDLKEKGTLDAKYYENVEEFLPIFKMLYSQDASIEDLLRPLKDYEVNKRCLRSIKHQPRAGNW